MNRSEENGSINEGKAINDANKDFYLEEYRSVRSEIAERMKLDQQVQRHSNLGIIAVVTIFYSKDFRIGNSIVIWAAAFLALYALFQQSRFKVWGNRLGDYSHKLEEAFKGSAVDLGWQEHIASSKAIEEEERNRIGNIGLALKSIMTGRIAFSSTQMESTYWTLAFVSLVALASYETRWIRDSITWLIQTMNGGVVIG